MPPSTNEWEWSGLASRNTLARMLELALLALAAQVPAFDEPYPPSAYDRVVQIDSEESTFLLEHTIEFSGTLHVWARSEVDLALSVRREAGEGLGEDDDSGGGTTPYLALEVSERDAVVVHVDGKESPVGGLHASLVLRQQGVNSQSSGFSWRRE